MVWNIRQWICSPEIKELEELMDGFESEKEKYYNNKYPKTDIFYAGRQVPKVNKNISIDVKNFFMLNDANVIEVSNEIISSIDDEIAFECLEWVIKNIKYVTDNTKGFTEYWQFPFETLHYRTGDCEDGAIFLANLMIMKGVPYWKIRLSAGWVTLNGKNVGHAYLTYYCEDLDKWVILDWCYWPNKLEIKDRKNYKDEEKYLDVWFSWNQKYSFSEGLNTEAKEVLQ